MSETYSNPEVIPSTQRFFELWLLGDRDEDLCFIDSFVEGIGYESWRTGMGERLAPVYPTDARIPMSKKRPGIQLTSFLGNSINTLIGSREFKEAIELQCGQQEIEYLSFTLYDHRNRPYSQDYFIINPIGTFDCLDFKASDIDWSKERPDEILFIETHVLDRNKMKDAPQLFRVGRDTHSYVIGVELIREFKKRGLTNILVEELEFSDSEQARP
ncbi:hypothetical protein HPC49_01945 [Pyxidicoccus fallax]|uniref:Uncharacterized protein n=1 Tax=Pyxidicoccus fallax TaxID=394095 RepID=A0A848L540_9BACT|nr:hypothetical protein [Pyxidicoccus fallax]NMO13799.1 hypothetical protein [Pyxidicoccus fallax]NPC77014.1 hypothetical protein [Pyxidicoccus fallax]